MQRSIHEWYKWEIEMRKLIVTLLLLMSTFCAMAEEMEASQTSAPVYGYSISMEENGTLIWKIKDPDGGVLDVAPEEKQRILREICFPRTLKHAEEGKTPQVWVIGFFYMDGVATEKDLEKAEVAFRRGLEIDHPEGLLFLASIYHTMAAAEKQEDYFRRAGELYIEVLAAGFKAPVANMTSLASSYMRGKHGVKKDLSQAEALLKAIEKIHPESPNVQLKMAELHFFQKRYPEAFDSAESAEKGLLEDPKKLKQAKAFKILAALRAGQISKIDPLEFMEMGLTGPSAWAIPSILLLALGFLLWRTRRTWKKEPRMGPGLRLSLFWIAVSILGAGIGFSIRLPGLDDEVVRWIGAILIFVFCLLAMTGGGWRRYFGPAPICAGPKTFFKGLAIIIGCIVGMIIILFGYTAIYEWIIGHALDQQLVSLFMKCENLGQLFGMILIAGIAIPFYEEVIYRGFLYGSLNRRWGSKVALIVSSVVFALVHGPTYAPPLLFLAFALGWVRHKTGNLKMSFLIHAANNSFAILMGYFFAS